MKHIFSIALLLMASLWQAQVIIGDDKGTATTKTSVLLEFANTNDKGIVLPYVRTLPVPGTANQGSFVLDVTNLNAATVKYSTGAAWVSLSKTDGIIPKTVMDAQPNPTSEDGKVIIGATTSSADGVLVLESTDKAMVLPIVTNYLNIKNPAPGMMALLDSSVAGDTAAVRASKLRLIVFNGSKWSFWKP